MINAKQFLNEELKNIPALSAIVGTRIYPKKAPIDTQLPLVTFSLRAGSKVDRRWVQNYFFLVNVRSKDELEADEARRVIIQHFNCFQNTSGVRDTSVVWIVDEYEPTSQANLASTTLKITLF